jgi:hypothetical protein
VRAAGGDVGAGGQRPQLALFAGGEGPVDGGEIVVLVFTHRDSSAAFRFDAIGGG